MKRLQRANTPNETNEYYPKVLVLSDGYTRIDEAVDLPDTVDGFILEPVVDYSENIRPFYIYALPEGGVLFNMPPLGEDSGGGDNGGDNGGGGITAIPFVTTFGSTYAGDTWIDLPIPEPTDELGSTGVMMYNHDNLYLMYEGDVGSDYLPIETLGGDIIDPELGVILRPDGSLEYGDQIAGVWGIFTNNGVTPYSYAVIHEEQGYGGGGGGVSNS